MIATTLEASLGGEAVANKKFTATAKKTKNDYVTMLIISETYLENDHDGYVQIKDENFEHVLTIYGHNSYNRATAMANCINK